MQINASANLANRPDDYVEAYVEYLAILAGEGVTFALGSDAHVIGGLKHVHVAWEVARRLGIPAERLWRPPGEPIVGGPGAGA